MPPRVLDNTDLPVGSQYAVPFLQTFITSPEAFCIKDPSLCFVYANPAYRSLLGLPEALDIAGLCEANLKSNTSGFLSDMRQHERIAVHENRSRTALVTCPVGQEKKFQVYFFKITPIYSCDGRFAGTFFLGKAAQHLPMGFYLNPFSPSCQLVIGTPGKLFTNREWDIVFLLNQGKKQKDIANRLGISFKTVRNKVYEILQKVSAKNTEDLIKICQSNGWHNYVPEDFLCRQYVLLKSYV